MVVINPIEFPEQNVVFVAECCDDLPACKQFNEQFGCQEVISLWEFSEEDCKNILHQIENGKRPAVYLAVIGGQPPVGLWIKNE